MYVSKIAVRALTIGALVATGAIDGLTACEGEPPVNAPENPSGSAPGVVLPAPDASPEPAPQVTAAASLTACPPPPCTPAASASAMGAVDGAAAPVASVTPAEGSASAVPPPAIPRGHIVGTITAKPAALKGQAVVYLEDGPMEDQPAHLQTVTIANRQMNFIPYVTVAGVGAKVVFTNEDPFPHNVFSPDNDKFNMGNIPQNGARAHVFKSAGVYSLLCNLHPGMLGYLLVTPSAWFARADANGRFTMKHVPSGSYRITAWAPRQKPITQDVKVADGDVEVDFELHR
jgi:plastocyanin